MAARAQSTQCQAGAAGIQLGATQYGAAVHEGDSPGQGRVGATVADVCYQCDGLALDNIGHITADADSGSCQYDLLDCAGNTAGIVSISLVTGGNGVLANGQCAGVQSGHAIHNGHGTAKRSRPVKKGNRSGWVIAQDMGHQANRRPLRDAADGDLQLNHAGSTANGRALDQCALLNIKLRAVTQHCCVDGLGQLCNGYDAPAGVVLGLGNIPGAIHLPG